MKKWTRKQLDNHINKNLGEGKDYSYGGAVVVAILYRKIYGEWPKIGLSGQQAEFAQSVVDKLPEPKDSKNG